MKHGSLFSGIGGFDLAAEWVGWTNVFQVEIDKHCQQRLRRLFKNVTLYGDVRKFSGYDYKHTIDILSGGDPCQPHSVAGLGKGTDDVRFLWPEMFRIARELNVPWIVNENVGGSVANGVLDLKINDLEGVGYACQPYSIPAEAVGALHQRERIWLVAYNADFHRDNQITRSLRETKEEERSLEVQQHKIHQPWKPVDLRLTPSYADTQRLEEQYNASIAKRFKEGLSGYFGFGSYPHGHITRDVIESGIIRMLNGLPEGMDYAERNQRNKALGNAIVPQVAFEIFKAIEQIKQR